jgi:tetratricopeptide (TPR) repeat protein
MARTRTSDDLFQLVKSLTKSEKRYFKMLAKLQGGQKNYLRLFDAIDAQEQYDEEAIRRHFDSERFLNQFNVARKYLYDLVLKSLRIYHAEVTTSSRLKVLNRNTEILFEKGLREQAAKMAERGVRLASEHENFPGLWEATNWQSVTREGGAERVEDLEADYERSCAILDSMRNVEDYAFLLDTMTMSLLQRSLRTDDDLARMEKILQHPLLRSEENATSVASRLLYNWAHSAYHYWRGEYDEALRYTNRQIDLFESHPPCICDHPTKYIGVLSNRILLHKNLDQREDLWKAVDSLNTAGASLIASNRLRGERLRYQVFANVAKNLLSLYIEMGEYERAEALMLEVRQGLPEYEEFTEPGDVIFLYYCFARIEFMLGRYRNALDRINFILSQPEPNHNKSHYYSSRLLELLVHYELGNMDLLEYLVPSVCRFLRARGAMHQFETAFLEFFRKLPSHDSKGRLGEAMAALRDRLLVLAQERVEAEPFRHFDYVEWLESKIGRRPMLELLREPSGSPRRRSTTAVAA